MADPTPTLTPLPPEEAIGFLKAKGYRVSFAWQDMWQAEHAHAFTVAKMMKADLLAEVHGSLVKAIADGQSYEQWAADIEPRLQAAGWWGRKPMVDPADGRAKVVQLGSPRRLRIIFDTNVRMAQAAGQWERIERVKAARPYLRYVAVKDTKTRPDHAAWHGTILPVDHAWWDERSPPCGWRCRCTLQQLSARDLERQGWTVTENPPPSDPRPWTNKRTGEEVMVPAGVDPGFAYHKGKAARDAQAARLLAQKRDALPPALRGAVDGPGGEPSVPPAARAVAQAESQVLERGRDTGHEHLVIVDATSGTVIEARTDGRTNTVNPSTEAAAQLADPARRLVVVHNHPGGSSLSPADLSATAHYPGIAEIRAIGHDGTRYAASVDRTLPAESLATMARAARRAAEQALLDAVVTGALPAVEANRVVAHAAVQALADAGHLVYTVQASPSFDQLLADRAAFLKAAMDAARLAIGRTA